MIIAHHLEQSRSLRVLWLLEELGLAYETKRYARNPETRRAPPELTRIHPLGKSPLLEIDGRALAESGAIVEFLAESEAGGKLAVAPGDPDRADYLYWLHYAEGSAMAPVMLMYFVNRLGEAGASLRPSVSSEIDKHLGYADRALDGRDHYVAGRFTAADVQMSAVSDAAAGAGRLADFPNLARVRAAMQQRPAWRRARERGGS